MKACHTVIAIALMSISPVVATEQEPEIVLLDGAVYYLPVDVSYWNNEPLESLWKNPAQELGLHGLNSSRNRGYVGIWEVLDSRLYLRALDAWLDFERKDKVNLGTVFPDQLVDGRVPADWHNGKLRFDAARYWSDNEDLGRCTLSFTQGRVPPAVLNTEKKSAKAPAVSPISDIFLFDGLVYFLPAELSSKAFPVEKLWEDPSTRPRLSPHPDGKASEECTRGYVAIWEVHQGSLYLLGLDAWTDGAKVNLGALFPQRFRKGRVLADWFTGELGLTKENRTSMPAVREKDRTPPEYFNVTIQVKDGQVVGTQQHNAKSPWLFGGFGKIP